MPASAPKFSLVSFFGKLLMLVVGAVLAGIGSYIFTEYIKPKPIFVNVQVFDDSDIHKPLRDVSVWLGLNDVEDKKTKDFGLARFEVPRKHRNEFVNPKLEITGYSRISSTTEGKFILGRTEMTHTYILRKDAPAIPEFDRTSYSSGAKASGAAMLGQSAANPQWNRARSAGNFEFRVTVNKRAGFSTTAILKFSSALAFSACSGKSKRKRSLRCEKTREPTEYLYEPTLA